jgi:hypothetical protein
MRLPRTGVEEIRHKLAPLSYVDAAKVWPANMAMFVNVNDRHALAIGALHRPADCVFIHHRASFVALDVLVVGQGMVGHRDEEDAIANERGCPARKKPDSLMSKRMRSS